MAKRKVKKGAEQLIYLACDLEILLVLGPDEERIRGLKEKGFVVKGTYRLSRTGGDPTTALPKTGIFADACSALATSPWRTK